MNNPLTIAAPAGDRADIYAHGAHTVSWKPGGNSEHLFLSAISGFGPGSAIRGGVPVIFPQFGEQGPLRKHGFARLCDWQAGPVEKGADSITATFILEDGDDTRRLWPHAFRAEMRIAVSPGRLGLNLTVTNPGPESFAFTAALHTYLRVTDVLKTTIEGLAGVRYHDTTVVPWTERIEAESPVRFLAELDRIYYAVQRPLRVCTPERVTRVETSGFPDAVLWNPGPSKSAALADMEPGGYRRFVCVEAAIVGQPVSVAPGGFWGGTQTLIAESL
jgi:glucose-6-phosphate 1-epimerase